MNVSVAIVIAGLILTVHDPNGGATLVLVNADQAGHPLKHHSFLQIPADAVASSSAGLPAPQPPEPTTHYVWNITGCQIQLDTSDPFDVVGASESASAAVSSLNRASFARVPHLKTELASNASIDPALWASPGTASRASATVTLAGGAIGVLDVARERSGEPTAFRFFDDSTPPKEPTPNDRRALASRLLLLASATNEIKFSGQDCAEKKIVLSRNIGESNPIKLFNIPLRGAATDTSHFAAFYEFLKGYTGPKYYPQPEGAMVDSVVARAATSGAKTRSRSSLLKRDAASRKACASVLTSACLQSLFKDVRAYPNDPFCPGSQWP